MRKVRVVQWTRPNGMWFLETPQGNLIVRGWDEAMFFAQLLADPARYIRESQAAVWEECAEEYCNYQWTSAGGTPYDPPRNPYWEDKTNDNDNA